MNKILVVGVLLLISVSVVSAMSVGFFYSEECQYCKQVYPIVLELSDKYKIDFYDINKGSYNIQGVPTVHIRTDDCRNIRLVGSQEIPRWLECELNEQSTMECPTYSGEVNPETQSWFIRQ